MVIHIKSLNRRDVLRTSFCHVTNHFVIGKKDVRSTSLRFEIVIPAKAGIHKVAAATGLGFPEHDRSCTFAGMTANHLRNHKIS